MHNMGKISSEMNNLSEVILNSNRTFHIPDFQRDFVWGSEEIDELFQDFKEDTDNFSRESSELQGYLLGNIVIINDGELSLVVDGQQRLTTMSLIFKALYETVKEKSYDNSSDSTTRDKWLQKLGGLNKGFQNLDDAEEFKGLKITHEPSLPFGEYYKGLIRDTKGLLPKTTSDENIESVYNSILENIEALNEIQLGKLIAYLRTKVMLIVTTAPSRSKAFQLFEVLNDRGRSLEPMDLVKNLFLKQMSTAGFDKSDQENFNQNWSTFINNMQISPRKKISSSTFMKHFITSEFGKNLKQDKLFDFFDKGDSTKPTISPNEILQFSRKLVNASEIYKEIEKSPASNLYSGSQNMFILFKLLGLKQFHPLLICFYNSTTETKELVLDAIVRYGASILFSFTQTNMIERELPIIINSILKKDLTDEEKAKIVVNRLNELIEDQLPLLETLIPSKNYANPQGHVQRKAINMLKFIELYFNKNTIIMNPPQNKKISVEHILSRALQIDIVEYGFESEKEHREYLNHIGNLTLLYNAENSALGNALFSDKIDAYSKTDLRITKTIVEKIKTSVKAGKTAQEVNYINEYQPNYVLTENKIWNKNKIDERGANIAKLISVTLSGRDKDS